MIKFWTFQSKYTLDKLCKYGIYFPDFKNTCQFVEREYAYNYILNIYNRKNIGILYKSKDIRLLGRRISGLVFGITEGYGNKILSYEDYCNVISKMLAHGFSTSVSDYYLLELELPFSEDEILPIEFDRFSDLIQYTGIDLDTKELDGINLDSEIVKQNLFKPNLEGNDYVIKQSHIAYIDRSMIKNIYPAIEYCHKDNKFIESIIDNNLIRYYKNRLL